MSSQSSSPKAGMRRSICFCEPAVALAGATSTWRFILQTANDLKAGACLKFDLASRGRAQIDWELPSVQIKGRGKLTNVIYGELEDGTVVPATEVEAAEYYTPQYEFALPKGMKAGETFAVVVGAPPKKGAKAADWDSVHGNRAQTNIQRRRQAFLYIDPKGKGNYDAPETFSMDIRGNKLHRIRILTPAFVVRNRRFDVTLRFEDEHGNLTSNAPEDTLIDLSYENLRETLNWKLFVPETGFVTLPNLYFNEPGVYRLQLKNLKTEEEYQSAPVKCFNDNANQLFWGLLHGESERWDGSENAESALRYFRDEVSLNFYATSPPEQGDETPPEIWKTISQNVATFNEEDRFSVILGFQYQGDSPSEGVRQLLYYKDAKPILRRKDLKNNLLSKIYKSSNPKEMLAVPLFPMGKDVGWDYSDYAPEFERVVEIYNSWGSSECSAKDGNPRPILCPGKKGIKEFPAGSVQEALRANCRFGFVAGGLDDRGVYAGLYQSDQVQYSPGLTAILAPKHSRDGLLEALYRRSCYATTGARILLGFTIAGAPMGHEMSTGDRPGLKVNRHIAGFVAGTTDVDRVEIVRNGEVIKELTPEGDEFEFAHDDLQPLQEAVIVAKDGKPPFAYYYLRVFQGDGHIAWSSPIWIDLEDTAAVPKKNRRNGKEKSRLAF